MHHRLLLAVVLVLNVAACVQQAPPPRPAPPPIPSADAVDRRQRELEFRIEQGVKSGHITGDERQLLRNQADDIRRDERRYMNDGVLSPDERRALWSRQDALARELDRQLRDKDIRR